MTTTTATNAISAVELFYIDSKNVSRIAGTDKKLTVADKIYQFSEIENAMDLLYNAIRAEDLPEQLEQVMSVAVSLFGFVAKLKNQGADLNKAMIKTSISNLSKFPTTLEEAQNTVEYYKREKNQVVSALYNEEYKVYVIRDEAGNYVAPISFIENDLRDCFPQ